MARKRLGGFLAALHTAVIAACMGAAAPAGAETLATYYKTLIAVRKCELSVDEVQLAKLQEIIENRVTDTDASSDTINAVFDQIAAEIGDDTQAFCAAYAETALSLLAEL